MRRSAHLDHRLVDLVGIVRHPEQAAAWWRDLIGKHLARTVAEVLSPFAEPADIARLGSTVERINRSRPDSVAFEIVEREDVKHALLEILKLRERGLRMTEVKGSATRVFRNPHEHGSFDAPRLGRLHPSLPRVSRRVLAQLAAGHGLARVRAFGSSVRADFRRTPMST